MQRADTGKNNGSSLKKGVQFNNDINYIPESQTNVESVAGPVMGVAVDTYDYNSADFGGSDEKPCAACTFFNPVSAVRCSICDTPF